MDGKKTRWLVIEFKGSGVCHVIPEDDIESHECTQTCWCSPVKRVGVDEFHEIWQHKCAYEEPRN